MYPLNQMKKKFILLTLLLCPGFTHLYSVPANVLPAISCWIVGIGAESEQRVLNQTAIAPDIDVPRSMWVWNTHLALDPKEQKNLLHFCELRNIQRLYLYTGKSSYFNNSKQRAQLSVFITLANAHGIAVEALDGWPEALLAEAHQDFLDSLKRVLDYNQSVPEEARFVGFQSDVEPVVLGDYNQSKAKRLQYDQLFLQLNEKCKAMVDQYADDDFVFGIALFPHHDDEGKDYQFTWKGKHGWLSDHLIDIVDYFALMSYSDSGKETIRMAEYEIALGNQAGKPVWVGCETLDVYSKGIGSRAITFAEEGVDYMEKQLALVVRQFAEEESFAGLAIHYYDAYRYLPSALPTPSTFLTASAQPLPATVTVDAQLDEWSDNFILAADTRSQLVHGRNVWLDADDLSAQIRVGWTPDALHFAVDVQDNQLLQFGPDAQMWQGDHIEIWIQAPIVDRIYQLGFTPGDFKDMPPHSWVWYPKELDATQRAHIIDQLEVAAVQLDDSQYRLECKIPASILGIDQLQAGMEIRLSCEVGDADVTTLPHESLLSISPALNKNNPLSFALLKLEEATPASIKISQ